MGAGGDRMAKPRRDDLPKRARVVRVFRTGSAPALAADRACQRLRRRPSEAGLRPKPIFLAKAER